jgi:hypothetical protein
MATKTKSPQRKLGEKRTRQGNDLQLRSSSLNAEARTVEAVISTDQAVEMWGTKEILTAGGMTIRGGKDSIVILDSHNRGKATDALGRASGISQEGNAIVATLKFGKSENAEEIFRMVVDGTLTDVSIGYSIKEETFVREGESLLIDGQRYEGPAYIATAWELSEVSIVPIGADTNATLRQEAEFTTPNPTTTEVENVKPETQAPETPAPSTPAPSPDVAAEQKRAADKARREERQRISDLTAAARAANLSTEDLNAAIDDDATTVEAFQKRCLGLISERNKPQTTPKGDTPVEVTRDQSDSLITRGVNKLLHQRFGKGANLTEQEVIEAQGMRTLTLHGLCRSLLHSIGDNQAVGYTPYELITATLNRRSANHTTSVLSNIVLDAMNKSLRGGRTLNPGIWRQIADTRPVTDFKTINNIALATSKHLGLVNENGEYPEDLMKDSKESYAPEQRGQILSISFKTLVNDDLGALMTASARQGDNAERTLDMLVLSLIMGTGQTMADAVALFNAASHFNYTASGTAMSVASLQVGENLIQTQKDENGNVLSLTPSTLICSSAKGATARQLLDSQNDPSLSGNITNPFRGRYNIAQSAHTSAGFTFDGTAYAAEPNAWYLITNPAQLAAIEVCAIDGRFDPELVTEEEFTTKGAKLRTTFEVGAHVIDWRGIYKNNGA